jgi:hypothetical protein
MGELKAKHLQQENKEFELKAKQLEQENKALQENKELYLGLTGYQVCVRVGLCVLQRNKTVCVRVAEQSGVFASSVCISVYMLYY